MRRDKIWVSCLHIQKYKNVGSENAFKRLHCQAILKIKVEGIYSFSLNPAVHTTAFVHEYFKYIVICYEISYH
jgi:hypothetical protein